MATEMNLEKSEMSCFAFLNSSGKEKKRGMGVCRNEEQTKMKNGSKIRIQVKKKTFLRL
jgi:hypothetical protein